MILVRKHFMTNVKDNNGGYVQTFKILLPNSENFKKVLNVLNLKNHYEKKMIRVGSVVRLSYEASDYYFGYDDYLQCHVTGSNQTVKDILEDGEIIFENPKDEKYLNPEYINYGLTEIVEIIKY